MGPEVASVAVNPTYTYNPNFAFKGVKAEEPFEIAPGPNNPVGTAWIDLTAMRVSGKSAPHHRGRSFGRWPPTGRGRRTEQNHGRRGVRACKVSDPGIPADDQPGADDQGGQPAKIEIACQDAVVAEASGSGHNQAAVTF